MDVQHPPLPGIDQATASAAACSRRGRRSRCPPAAAPRRSPLRAPRGRRGTADGRSPPPRTPASLRQRQARRIGPVRNHQHDLGRDSRIARRRDQRGHVGAAAADQDGGAPCGWFVRHHPGQPAGRSIRTCGRPAACFDTADPRDALALVAQQFARGIRVGDHHRHADAAVEHPQHLLRRARRRCAPASRTPAGPTRTGSSTATVSSGSTRGRLPGRPPPVMCAAAFSNPARCSASSAGT